jgi:hypothetical protein
MLDRRLLVGIHKKPATGSFRPQVFFDRKLTPAGNVRPGGEIFLSCQRRQGFLPPDKGRWLAFKPKST